jgi:OFA family oxalate/formate antiporter-like MFS transporter
MPAFILDVFGSKTHAIVYGTVLTAWSAGGIVGPQMVALLKDTYKDAPAIAAKYTFLLGACILTFGLLVTLLSSNKPYEKK